MQKYFTVVVFGVLLVCISSVFAATSYRVASGTEQCITEQGVQKKVKNTCAQDIFVPTSTLAEWNVFIANAPACVQLSPCYDMLYKSVHNTLQCTNAGGTVVTMWEGKLCRLPGSSCSIAGWTRYPNYASCSSKSCSGSGPCGGLSSADFCSVNTVFGPQPYPVCSCILRVPGGVNDCAHAWCISSVTSVGCY